MKHFQPGPVAPDLFRFLKANRLRTGELEAGQKVQTVLKGDEIYDDTYMRHDGIITDKKRGITSLGFAVLSFTVISANGRMAQHGKGIVGNGMWKPSSIFMAPLVDVEKKYETSQALPVEHIISAFHLPEDFDEFAAGYEPAARYVYKEEPRFFRKTDHPA